MSKVWVASRATQHETWDKLMEALVHAVGCFREPAVTVAAKRKKDPFRVLVATIISARTKDEVTGAAAERLFALADSPKGVAELDVQTIAEAIRPANFYPTKARRIKEIATRLVRDFHGQVPNDLEALLTLPGVGRKTANLVLTEGFGLPGICVDTHVHRILNRLGLVRTRSPLETEHALRESLPQKYWAKINALLVSFGQNICRPQSPYCSKCPLNEMCERKGVARSR